MAPSPLRLDNGVIVEPTLIHLSARYNKFTANRLEPNDTQKITLIVLAIFMVMFLMWPFGYYILWPFRMIVTALHEFSHALAAILTCTRVNYIVINPDSSGLTETGAYRNKFCAIIICSAGYVGSALIGCAFVFAGFNVVASKGATIGLGVIFLITLFWARKDWITWVTCLLTAGIVVGCWFIDHARPLRYLVLLLGVMSSFWSLKDTYDILRGKVSGTDAHNLARVAGMSPKFWAFSWNLISITGLVGAILLGLMFFKETDQQMLREGQKFLPTM